MSLKRTAISTVAVMIVIVVIIAAAGSAAYVAVLNHPTQQSSSSSSSAEKNTTMSEASSSSALSSSEETAVSTSESQTTSSSTSSFTTSGGREIDNVTFSSFTSYTQILQNFSSLDVNISQICVGNCTEAGSNDANMTGSVSYVYNGTEIINSTTYQVYNFLESETSVVRNGTESTATYAISGTFQFLVPPGNSTSYLEENGTLYAQSTSNNPFGGDSYLGVFLVNASLFYSQGYSWHLLNQSSESLNGLQLALSTYYGNQSIYSTTVVDARIVGTNLAFPISAVGTTYDSGYQLVVAIEVTSLKRA